MKRAFVIAYEPSGRGKQTIYIRTDDPEYDDTGVYTRSWPTDIQQATRFHTATQAAQYMMKMGAYSSSGGPRSILQYSIVEVMIGPPPPVPLTDAILMSRKI